MMQLEGYKHLNLRDRLWIARRLMRDGILNIRRTICERWRAFAYRRKNPQEARKTGDCIYLIYTMGKVASMSVLDAISRRLPHAPVFAMHFLNARNLQQQEQQLGSSVHLGNRMYRKIHSLHARKIRRCIAAHPLHKIRIITLVREPLSQIISQIFQQRNLHDLESLKKMTLSQQAIDFDYSTAWCRDELQEFSGINVMKETFRPERGYEIYRRERFELLLLRFEDIKRVFQEAMSEFTDVQNFALGEKNRAADKHYADEYARFKNEFEIELAALDRIYSSPFVQHFYTDDEISWFRRQWKTFER